MRIELSHPNSATTKDQVLGAVLGTKIALNLNVGLETLHLQSASNVILICTDKMLEATPVETKMRIN